MKFTEEKLELAFIESLGNEDFDYTPGAQIRYVHDNMLNEPKGSYSSTGSEVLIKSDLKKFLLTQYKNQEITEDEVTTIIRDLEKLPASDLYESNKTIMKKISDGYNLKREDPKKKDFRVYFIDYSEKNNNTYRIVNQLEIQGFEKRIPDVILYINGLPLVVIEFKSAIREDATIYNAYAKLTVRYKRDIPELFKYNAFFVISDGVNNKAGSFFAPYEYY